jgi:hypothetical protein
MTKQQQALLAAKVQRAVEIKNMISDLTDELDAIKEVFDLSGLDRLDAGDHSAVKVVQEKRLFSQAEACKLLGTKAEKCFYTKPSIFWRFN